MEGGREKEGERERERVATRRCEMGLKWVVRIRQNREEVRRSRIEIGEERRDRDRRERERGGRGCV